MIIYVDIDGTICTLNNSDGENKDQSFDPAGYEDAQPIYENIDKINKLYDEGHTIIYWTARGTVTKIDWIELSYNPNAISLLEQNQDKIDWVELSGNPNAIHLLEQNMDKINWNTLSENPSIFKLNTKKIYESFF